jgi:hypothetical protein
MNECKDANLRCAHIHGACTCIPCGNWLSPNLFGTAQQQSQQTAS